DSDYVYREARSRACTCSVRCRQYNGVLATGVERRSPDERASRWIEAQPRWKRCPIGKTSRVGQAVSMNAVWIHEMLGGHLIDKRFILVDRMIGQPGGDYGTIVGVHYVQGKDVFNGSARGVGSGDSHLYRTDIAVTRRTLKGSVNGVED